MNKEKLEKMFNEKVTSMRIYDEYGNEITESKEWNNICDIWAGNMYYQVIPTKIWIQYKIWFDWNYTFLNKNIIAESFRRYWWSFVRLLWNALFVADQNNTYKLLNTWLEYVWEYFVNFIKDDLNL